MESYYVFYRNKVKLFAFLSVGLYLLANYLLAFVFLTKWSKRDFSCFFIIIILSPEFFKFGKVTALLKKGDHCHVNNYGQIIVLQR